MVVPKLRFVPSDVIMEKSVKCAVMMRHIGDVCMQPVCDADSDVMILYQENM